MIDQTLSHYRTVAKIGAAGMRKVYRARVEHPFRDITIKALPAGTLQDERARQRFRVEGEARSKLIRHRTALPPAARSGLPGDGNGRGCGAGSQVTEGPRQQKEIDYLNLG